ncbi:hypothetical protein BJ322DRAFT_1109084 [Thelephora terrestris]|uniref:Uncharacterized protein n=1 Tax=Thelephora terrestris TaxID=56493 RepID=A0A9P6HCK0_9AGAM|nr:hypothetical protein BJ322DRAFT_1109084 [Thelephora terrestris]
MDHHFSDEVVKAMVGHMDSLLPPQGSALPSPQNGVCVPQRSYSAGASLDDHPGNQPRVPFIRADGSYLPVKEALAGVYGSLIHRDSSVLGEAGPVVNIRFEWPGYQSKDYLLRTIDWCVPPKKIPLRTLATKVAGLVKTFVEVTQGKPIDPNHAMWRVGQDGIRVEHLRLAAFEQVSAGTWQTRLFCMTPH